MSDDIMNRIARNGGCRLCLAPDTECVPIFATAAADKEPLSNKILSCVSIKVSHLMNFCSSNFIIIFYGLTTFGSIGSSSLELSFQLFNIFHQYN